MKKIGVVMVGILSVLLLSLIVLPRFLPWKSLHSYFISQLSPSDTLKIDMGPKVKVRLLPLPMVTFEQVSLTGTLEGWEKIAVFIPRLELQGSIKEIIQGKIVLQDIHLKNALIELHQNKENSTSLWQILPSLFKGNLRTVECSNTTLRYQNELGKIREIEAIEAKATVYSATGPLKITAKAHNHQHPYTLEAKLAGWREGQEEEVKIRFTAAHNAVEVQGKSLYKEEKFLFTGALQSEITDVMVLTGMAEGGVVSKDRALTLKGELTLGEEELQLSNLTLQGKAMKGQGSGRVTWNEQPRLETEVTIEQLNLDQLIGNNAAQQSQEVNMPGHALSHLLRAIPPRQGNGWLDLLTMNSKISIQNITYHGKEIASLAVAVGLDQGDILFHVSPIVVLDRHLLEWQGRLTRNEVRSLLLGHFSLSGSKLTEITQWLNLSSAIVSPSKHNHYSLDGEFLLSEDEIRLFNVTNTLDEKNITGTLSYRALSTPRLYVAARTPNLDGDQLQLTPWLHQHIKAVAAVPTENPMQPLQGIRNFQGSVVIALDSDQTTVNKVPLGNTFLAFSLTPQQLAIDTLVLKGELAQVSGQMKLMLAAIRPDLHIRLQGAGINTQILSALIPSASEGTKVAPPENASLWSQQPYNFFPIDKFNGDFKIKLDQVISPKAHYQNVVVAGEMNANQGVVIHEMQGEVWGGKVKLKGNVTLSPVAMAGTFALHNVYASNIVESLLGLKTVSGYLSTSGSFSFRGRSPYEWISGLQMAFSIAGRQLKVDGIDVDRVMNTLGVAERSVELLESTAASAVTSGSTIVHNLDGQIIANGGVLQIQSCQFDTDRTRGVVGGSINLQNWGSNLISKVATAIQGEKDPLTMDIKISGDLRKPVRAFDVKVLKEYLQKVTMDLTTPAKT